MNNDLISRAALLAKLDELFMAALRKTGESVETIYHLDHLSVLVKDAPAVDAEPVRQWISVKDALPDRQCEYLVRYGFGEPIIQGYSGVMYFVLYDERPHFENDGLYGLKVTHWMPLPEAPKGDEQ